MRSKPYLFRGDRLDALDDSQTTNDSGEARPMSPLTPAKKASKACLFGHEVGANSKPIIRVGDCTSHGGRVLTGCDHYTEDGIAVARMGDLCSCPVHGSCRIVEGDPDTTIDGRPVACHGHRTDCGAVLISELSTTYHMAT